MIIPWFSRPRSHVEVKGHFIDKISHLNIGHNNSLSPHTHLIFDVHMYLKVQHVFSKSRSHIKVKSHFIEIDLIVHDSTVTGPMTFIFDMWVPYDNAYHLIPYFKPCDLTLTLYNIMVNKFNIVHCFSPHAQTNCIFGMLMYLNEPHILAT